MDSGHVGLGDDVDFGTCGLKDMDLGTMWPLKCVWDRGRMELGSCGLRDMCTW